MAGARITDAIKLIELISKLGSFASQPYKLRLDHGTRSFSIL